MRNAILRVISTGFNRNIFDKTTSNTSAEYNDLIYSGFVMKDNFYHHTPKSTRGIQGFLAEYNYVLAYGVMTRDKVTY